MKKSILLFTAAAGLLFTTACQQFKKGDGGLEYKIVKDAGAEKAVAGDLMAVDLIVSSDRKDSVLQTTYDAGLPQIVQIAPDSIPGLYPGDYNSMFKFLGEGDSAIFRLNLDTMAARMSQPKPEFADKYVTFNVKVRKIFKKGDLTDSLFYDQVNKYFEAEVEGLKKAEESKLANYIKSNKLEPTKTASGLQYIIKEEGKGAKPVIGDTVLVNYKGFIANTGKVFDTNIVEEAKKEKVYNAQRPYEPFRFSVGNDPVIRAWTEGIQLFNKGTKATLIVPSALGYGDRGDGRGAIGPFAPLVFEIELIDVIPGPKVDSTAAPVTQAPSIPVN